MTIHEMTFRFDDESMRHKVLAVLFDEIRNLELLHNEADAKITAALASIAEHRDVITGRGRYPERLNECHCEGCKMARALTPEETPNA